VINLRFIERRKKSGKKSKSAPKTEKIDALIKDINKPDCEGEPMSDKKNFDVYRYRYYIFIKIFKWTSFIFL